MYVLTRYVIWEALKFFLAALLVLTLFLSLGMGVNEGLRRGAPPVVMLRIIPAMLPEMLGITIPVALLFSVSSVFGRMTGANEVVALKSLGISPMAVVWPALVLATFLSLGTVWMYEIAATWCRPYRDRVFSESLEDIAYSMLQKNSKSFDCPQFAIAVTAVEGRKLIQPTIIIKDSLGQPKATLHAAEATLWTDMKKNPPVLVIEYTDSDFDVNGMQGSNPMTDRQSMPINIPIPDRTRRDWVAMREIPDSVALLRAQIANGESTLRQLEELREAHKILGTPESADEAANIAGKSEEINDKRHKIFALRAESYRRWSNGFTCLCFALIGTPVAMLRRNADVLTNFFSCFLPILIVYYPLLMLSDHMATSGRVWPVLFWTADLALFLPAIFLLRRVIRH